MNHPVRVKKNTGFIVAILLPLLSLSIAHSMDDPTVYVTKTGSEYHTAGCSFLKRSATPMKLSEAIKQYSPCNRCNPPTSLAQADKAVPLSGKLTPLPTSSVIDTAAASQRGSGKAVGTTPHGQTIYEGPRGGHYHYSKSGKKVYERKKH